MGIAHLILGIILLMLGAPMALGRKRLVALQQRRFPGRQVQEAMIWLILGTILAAAGAGQVLTALR